MFRLLLKFALFLFSIVLISSCEKKKVNTPKKLNRYEIVKDLEWAKPKGHSLTMDVYIPETGKKSYPVLVVYHGGGWLINTKSVMDSLSTYIVEHSEFIVCNMNYRLLGDLDNTVKLNEIVEDAIGGYLWVKEHISNYGGDPSKIALTGDSAGAHLASMVFLSKNKLEEDGFELETQGYKPTYAPEGKTIASLIENGAIDIKAVILNYGVFNVLEYCKNGYELRLGQNRKGGIFGENISIDSHPQFYETVSPFYLIPEKSEYKLPKMLITVGEKDKVTTPSSIHKFMKKLENKGQEYEYWEYKGRPHAYLDSHKNTFSGIDTEFGKDGPEAVDKMIEFLEKNLK